MIVVGPPLETHLGDPLRLDPYRCRVDLGLLAERVASAPQWLEQTRRRSERRVIEARADVRGEMQLVTPPIADQQRAERRARPLALCVAADHELGAVGRLDLHPGGRALAAF